MPSLPRVSRIKAITFDFYNTLVYHRTGLGRGAMLMEYLEEHGFRTDPWEHQVLYDVFALHGNAYDPGQAPERKRGFVREFTRSVFERLNVRATEETIAEHAHEVWRLLGPASLAVFPEVATVLRGLCTAGYPLAVISNWQRGLAQFCNALGIGDAFDHVLASAEVGAAKPDAAIFYEASRRLEVAPRRILHIGDSPVDDYEGGRGAGFNVVLVCRELQASEEASPTISSLEGVLEIVRPKTDQDGPRRSRAHPDGRGR